MREILFRGKRKDNGEWVEGFLCDKNIIKHTRKCFDWRRDYVCDSVEEHRVDIETIGQFTGLTDKNNGKKIFEGDIVAYNTLYIDGKEYQEIGYFECDKDFVSFRIHGKNMTPFHCEVIGNIYDNPELLEESNENQTK